MKIAVTSMGGSMDSMVSERFGRAPYFIIFDMETGKFSPVLNNTDSMASGAGPEAVRQLSEQDAKVVLTGQVGGNAAAALKAAGITAQTGASGTKTVRQVIEEFKSSSK